MTIPDVTFPAANPDVAHIECADGSKRDPNESLGQPCHVCGHFACRIGPQGPVPCESCWTLRYIRTLLGSNITETIGLVETLTNALETQGRQLEELRARLDRANSFPI